MITVDKYEVEQHYEGRVQFSPESLFFKENTALLVHCDWSDGADAMVLTLEISLLGDEHDGIMAVERFELDDCFSGDLLHKDILAFSTSALQSAQQIDFENSLLIEKLFSTVCGMLGRVFEVAASSYYDPGQLDIDDEIVLGFNVEFDDGNTKIFETQVTTTLAKLEPFLDFERMADKAVAAV